VISSRNRVFLWVGITFALNWLVIVALEPPNSSNKVLEGICIAIMLGSLFGNTTVAAAWAAFGPGRIVWRAPLSLFGIALLASGIGINTGIRGGPSNSAFMFGALLLMQWGLLQVPLWGLAISQGMHLQHAEATTQGMDPRERQFGLRQLILITAVIGVLFGIGRIVAPYFVESVGIARRDQLILVFLSIAEVILTLPLLLAALLKRRSVLAVALALLLIGLATVWEHQLLVSVSGPGAAGAGPHLFYAINSGTAIVLLMLLTIVRFNGYSLATSPASGNR
jgi:hypothetical protein